MATIRSSVPEAETRTPVRCGLVSSREAERATRSTVSTNAGVGTDTVAASAGLGQAGKLVGGQQAQLES